METIADSRGTRRGPPLSSSIIFYIFLLSFARLLLLSFPVLALGVLVIFLKSDMLLL
jgi:hypothetical protein